MDISNHRAAGSLDPDFATDGIFTFALDTYGPLTINGLVQDSDGNIITALMLADRENVANFYGIGRLLKDGTVDPDFGVNGVVAGQFSGNQPSFGGIPAINRDGKLLLSGYFITNGQPGARVPAIAQHLSTGEIDPDFGEAGKVIFDFPPPKSGAGQNDVAMGGPPDTLYEYFSFDITPLPDGKIVFSGVVEADRDNQSSRFSVLGRLNTDGSLDESFGNQGYIYPKGLRNIVDQHLVQSDGKILISGQMESVSGHMGYVARYLSEGTLDRGFGAAGYLFIPELDGGHVTALALYGHDSVLVGVNKPKPSGSRWRGRLLAFAGDGEPDPDFNGGQPVDISLGTTGFWLVLKDLTVDGDGVVLLGDAGFVALARYRLDGTPDLSYGNSGWWQYPGKESYDLARQPDGKILATGMGDTAEKFVARFLGH